MHTVLLLVAATLPGIDVGWVQLPDGSYDYIIQIEPEMLDRLREGQDIRSDLPPALRNISSYQIRVGTEPLPHEGIPPELVGQPAERDTSSSVDPLRPAEGPFLSLPREQRPGPGADVQIVEQRPEVQVPAIVDPQPAVAEQPPSRDEPVDEPIQPATPAEPPTRIAVQDPPRNPEDDHQPKPFTVPSYSKPLVERTAVYDGPSAADEEEPDEPEPASDDTAQPSLVGKPPVAEEPPAKPWWALSAAVLALFVSLGGNAYLAWVTWDTRLRYRSLLHKAAAHS